MDTGQSASADGSTRRSFGKGGGIEVGNIGRVLDACDVEVISYICDRLRQIIKHPIIINDATNNIPRIRIRGGFLGNTGMVELCLSDRFGSMVVTELSKG